jgi:hypothetical protein
MADLDLSNEDWLELYRFLLERLESKGLVDVRRAIEAAAAAPVFERGSDDEEARILKEFKGDVGQRALRRREPFEVFAAALDVIWTRLVELPEVARAIQLNIGGTEQQIEFRVDYEEQYAPRQSEPIPLSRLQLSEAERTGVHEAFDAIGVRPERLGQQ